MVGLVFVGKFSFFLGFVDFFRFICCKIEFNLLIIFVFGFERIGFLIFEILFYNLEVFGWIILIVSGWILFGGGGGVGGGIIKLFVFFFTSAF